MLMPLSARSGTQCRRLASAWKRLRAGQRGHPALRVWPDFVLAQTVKARQAGRVIGLRVCHLFADVPRDDKERQRGYQGRCCQPMAAVGWKLMLLLTDNRDQALLAMTVEEARNIADEERTYVGRTVVQKAMYFLRTVGVPMNYRFDIYHYGPFCQPILQDVDWLLADSVIIDKSNEPEKYSNYAPGDNLKELLDMHRESIEPYRDTVRAIVSMLIPMGPNRMELFSTLDYIYRQEKAAGRTSGWKEAILPRFKEYKGNKFPPDLVSQTYDIMAKVGLVEL